MNDWYMDDEGYIHGGNDTPIFAELRDKHNRKKEESMDYNGFEPEKSPEVISRDTTPETGTVKDEFNDPDLFLKMAKHIVADWYNRRKSHSIGTNDIYIVWFSKTLQNWKALLSTDLHDGLYYEVTHNGDKKETYIDVYSKIANVAYPY